jgi:hypothetical protein
MNENETERLSEYLDGSLDEATAGALEARLEKEAELRAELDALRAVRTAAAEQPNFAPATDLWPQVSARISSAAPVRRRRTILVTIPQFAAAAGIMLLLGVSLARMGADSPQPLPTVAGFETAPDAYPADYSLFVEDLEGRVEAGRGVLDDQTVKVLEQSLAKIDLAIDQARAALEADPSNAYLNQHLASSRARKLRVLESATALVASRT